MRTWFNSLFWRWRSRRYQRHPRLPAILLYHSVTRRERDPLKLGIDPARFEAHLDWLVHHTTPLPLAEFVDRHETGGLPGNAVAVTFDDGYADNFTIAAPMLERRGIPATVFVTTDYVNSPSEGWWDELEAIFLESPRLPERFAFEEFSCVVEVRANPTRCGWNVFQPPETLREQAFLHARAAARRMRRSQRDRFFHALRSWSEREEAARSGRGFPTWALIRSAARRGLVSIGAHTRSHPALSTLSFADQSAEIQGSCAALRMYLGTNPVGFAYPFGTHCDFSSQTIQAVQASSSGFACATMPAHFVRAHSRWQLPRVTVESWSVAELAAKLGV